MLPIFAHFFQRQRVGRVAIVTLNTVELGLEGLMGLVVPAEVTECDGSK